VRLARDPVPLEFGGAQSSSLDASLEGLINPQGTDARRIMEIFNPYPYSVKPSGLLALAEVRHPRVNS
jgi:hypothetical protein